MNIAPQSQSSLEIAYEPAQIKAKLLNLNESCYVVRSQGQIGMVSQHDLVAGPNLEILAMLPSTPLEQLGDPNFCRFHGVRYAYAAGAMAGGIASADLVIALGKAGLLGCFGSGGLALDRLEAALQQIQQALPQGPYAVNLIHHPSEPRMERRTVDLLLRYGVTTIEASAFLALTPSLVYYRAAGLGLDANQQIQIRHRIIAKLSRKEVAAQFMQPAPAAMLRALVEQGLITELQAKLAQQIPLADDITVEADSGGHTDNRPLVALLPSIISLRDAIQAQHPGYPHLIRVGAAGGISTPASALAALIMGAAYVVTGSVNQSCLEAGTSEFAKNLLAKAEMHDVSMAPAGDMFEMGVKLQVLKRGTLFAARAQKLYALYRDYDSMDAIPDAERQSLEKQIFQKPLEEVWQETVAFFQQRDPDQLERAAADPKRKMALIFRWYLGKSSRWAKAGEPGREADYQIWCGPAMGAFNEWVRGSYLEELANRRVVDVAHHILIGAAYLYRIQALKMQRIYLPADFDRYQPMPFS